MMAENGLILRDYTPEDMPSLVPIINDEWHFDLYGENWPEIVAMYVGEYVRRSDYCRVAVLDGKVVGIATVCTEMHDEPFPIPPELIETEYVRDQIAMDALDDRLRSENDISGLGELVLLIVSGSVRGKHVGSSLMGDMTQYLEARGYRGMHISTDTECNYGFYEHLGCRLIGSGEVVVQRKPITRFLYRYDFRTV